MRQLGSENGEDFKTLLAAWGDAWGLPQLASDVTISFNPRLSRSLGRCYPSIGRIALNTDLLQWPMHQVEEVLCHEVAHVAAFQLFGPDVKPHGAEWRDLVKRVGYTPEIRRRARLKGAPQSEPSRTLSYEHRCPVCQSVRLARRPVGSWRCAECLDAGLGGHLVITRRYTFPTTP